MDGSRGSDSFPQSYVIGIQVAAIRRRLVSLCHPGLRYECGWISEQAAVERQRKNQRGCGGRKIIDLDESQTRFLANTVERILLCKEGIVKGRKGQWR